MSRPSVCAEIAGRGLTEHCGVSGWGLWEEQQETTLKKNEEEDLPRNCIGRLPIPPQRQREVYLPIPPKGGALRSIVIKAEGLSEERAKRNERMTQLVICVGYLYSSSEIPSAISFSEVDK